MNQTAVDSQQIRKVPSDRHKPRLVGLLIGFVSTLLAATFVLSPSDPVNAASPEFGFVGATMVYTRSETRQIANLDDNRAVSTMITVAKTAVQECMFDALCVKHAVAMWKVILVAGAVAGGFIWINNTAQSAVAKGQCLGLYKPYLTGLFWLRTVPCRR